MFERLSEMVAGRFCRGRVLFSGTRRRATAVLVRGDQIASVLGGRCMRSRYITPPAVAACPALIWIVEAQMAEFRRFRELAPQILDVINPGSPSESKYFDRREFRYLFLNTAGSLEFLGTPPADGWLTWVIPHHHCNFSGYRLCEERIERPRVVGYVGEPEHLHDSEDIRRTVESLGLRWLSANSHELDAYREIDIGIAWTRPQSDRDATRSNIKFTNFAAHGIPSVVCDYESYRDVDRNLGGGSGLICKSLREVLDRVSELANNLDLRQSIATRAHGAYAKYSLQTIAGRYEDALREVREDFDRA